MANPTWRTRYIYLLILFKFRIMVIVKVRHTWQSPDLSIRKNLTSHKIISQSNFKFKMSFEKLHLFNSEVCFVFQIEVPVNARMT